jgi:hypothetical protein
MAGGNLPFGLAPSGELTSYTPTLRERATDFVRRSLFSDDRAGQGKANRVMDVANVTPFGFGLDVYDAGREAGQGNLGTAGMLGAMALIPGQTPKGGVIDFAQARLGRDRDTLVGQLKRAVADVKSGANQSRLDSAAFDLHRSGVLPLRAGTRVDTPSTWDLPRQMSIDGYWVDPSNPNRFGYKLTGADGTTHNAVVSDPKIGFAMKDPSSFGAGFKAFYGPSASKVSYPPRSGVQVNPRDTMPSAASSLLDEEYANLFGIPLDMGAK